MSKKRDAYVEKLRAKMDEWNAEIDKLKTKADQAEAELKMDYSEQLEDLQAKHKDIEDKLAELQQTGEGAWEDLREGLEKSWEILRISFSKAKSEFQRGYREGLEDNGFDGSQ
jgi:predicted  nucleic acid-binding Zn-ribbon protein